MYTSCSVFSFQLRDAQLRYATRIIQECRSSELLHYVVMHASAQRMLKPIQVLQAKKKNLRLLIKTRNVTPSILVMQK